MIDEDVSSLLKCKVRSDRSVCYNFKIELLVVGLLLYTPVLYCPVNILDRSIDSIYRNCSDRCLCISVLVSRNETASLAYGESHLDLDSWLKRADVQFRVKHLERRQSF